MNEKWSGAPKSGRRAGRVLRLACPQRTSSSSRAKPGGVVNRMSEDCDCVVADSRDGLRRAVDYLFALGHTRIAYVQGSARIVVQLAARRRRRGVVR